MAAANESQGLKIAVAAFVSLTVILAVTSYFLYSSYAQTYDKLEEAQKKLGTTNSALDKMNRDYVDFRTRAGYGKLVEGQEWQVEVKKDQDKANAKLSDATKAVADMVAEARKQGATDPMLADLTQRTELIVQDFLDEKKATFASSIDRLVELVSNLAQLTAAFSLDNIDLRSKLNSVDSINRGTVDAQEKVVQATRADLEKVQADHEQDRQALVTKLDQFQTLNSQLASENATLKTQLAQREEEAKKQLSDVSSQVRNLKTQIAKTADTMDSPDGRITYVDYTRREIRININRAMGARPQMRLAIFDKSAQGLPTEKPKGTAQLIEVGTGDSVARILQTNSTINPIRVDDLVYSPVWSPNEPQQFALIGKIDINRDNRDDRADLIRLIQASGGRVTYDLPPPGVGKETGELTGQVSRYVIDERDPFGGQRGRAIPPEFSPEEQRFNEKRTAAIQKADSMGISPISIQQLLPSLGYNFNMAMPGQVEALDRKASESLSTPRSRTPAGAGTPK